MTTSRTLRVLHLDGPGDSRVVPALELLREGLPIGYCGISPSLGATELSCCMQASWQPAARPGPRAPADFSHVQRSLEELRTARPHFDVVTRAPASSLLARRRAAARLHEGAAVVDSAS